MREIEILARVQKPRAIKPLPACGKAPNLKFDLPSNAAEYQARIYCTFFSVISRTCY
jgi:hypothetical protein